MAGYLPGPFKRQRRTQGRIRARDAHAGDALRAGLHRSRAGLFGLSDARLGHLGTPAYAFIIIRWWSCSWSRTTDN